MVNIHNVLGSAAVVHVPANQSNPFGTASLVLGIIATVFFCLPFISIPTAGLGFIFGVAGIVLGIVQKRPIATSIAGCVLIAVLFTIILTVGAAISSAFHH